MSNPTPATRAAILNFYKALRANDVAALEEFKNDGFPIAWAQAFSEQSLPEMAMKSGAIEATWWLMAQGVMPENWTAFTGNAWKNFLKKGFQMTVSGQGPSIPLDVYKKIAKVGLQTTGEKIPLWLDGVLKQSNSIADGLFAQLSKTFASVREGIEEGMKEATANREERLREAAEQKDTEQKNKKDHHQENDPSDQCAGQDVQQEVGRARSKKSASPSRISSKSIQKKRTAKSSVKPSKITPKTASKVNKRSP